MRHYEFMLGRTMKAMYCDFLVDTATSIPLKCQVRVLNFPVFVFLS